MLAKPTSDHQPQSSASFPVSDNLMAENYLTVPGSHVMHYRKKCHLNPYCNTGVTIIKLIKYMSTTCTVKTKLKTVFRISAIQKDLCLLLLNISVVVVPMGSH